MSTPAPAKPTGLALLRAPFPANQISKLPKPKSKDAPKGKCPECGGWHGLPAVHLDYVGHAALTDRLLDADPEWKWEPVAVDAAGLPLIDKQGGMWIRLTVCGVTRLGYGDAEGKSGPSAIKELIGDALRNAAMRFGAALDLWHKGDLHVDEEQPEPTTKPATKQEAAAPALDPAAQAKAKAECESLTVAMKKRHRSTAVAIWYAPSLYPDWNDRLRAMKEADKAVDDILAKLGNDRGFEYLEAAAKDLPAIPDDKATPTHREAMRAAARKTVDILLGTKPVSSSVPTA